MKTLKENGELYIQPRPTESVSIEIPVDTLESLKKVATKRDMSHQSLIKFYIGQGLRQDLARLFGDRILETTAEVLAKHLESEEEVTAILQEIRVAASD